MVASNSIPDDTGEPLLLGGDQWVVAASVQDRLRRQLERAPDSIAGVVAPARPLPPGSSHLTHSERAGLEPMSAVERLAGPPVAGAALVRTGVDAGLDDGCARVDSGELLVDPGTVVHRPDPPSSSLQVADPAARPPFPWRPVVLFLAARALDPVRFEWLPDLIDELLEHDVESRLALAAPTEVRPHLVEPCLADPASVRALAPDVVVTLDPAAAERAPSWCTSRGTTVIEHSPDVAGLELVSWQIGRAQGRVRARIGPRPEAAELARTGRRLTAGPHPEPPVMRRVEKPVTRTWQPVAAPGRRRVASRSTLILAAGADRIALGRLRALGEHLGDAGHPTELRSIDAPVRRSASTTDLVVIASSVAVEQVGDLVEARRGSGRPTVVDLAGADVVIGLNDATARLVEACGLATVAGPGALAALTGRTVRALVLPTLVAHGHVERLTAARAAPPSGHTIVGWPVPPGGGADPVVLDALMAVAGERADVVVELAGEGLAGMERADHPRVRFVPAERNAVVQAGWALQVWNPPPLEVAAGDIGTLLDACYLGVPTMTSPEIAQLIGPGPRPLVAAGSDGPQAWTAALAEVLDDDHARSRWGEQSARAWASLYGPGPSAAVVNRFIGWAFDKGQDR